MYSGLDRVSLFGIESDVKPEKITASYNSSQTDDLPVTSVGIFTAFENYPVDGNNPGYVKLGQEIIRYTGVSTSNGTITGITRAIDDTKSGDYSENQVVFKYELNGVSLRRINCEHSFESTDLSKYPLDIDHYWVKVGVSSRGTDRGVAASLPGLYFNETKSAGSYENQHSIVGSQNVPRATQNVPFNSLRTNVSILQPEGTGPSARVRTFTGNKQMVPFNPLLIRDLNQFLSIVTIHLLLQESLPPKSMNLLDSKIFLEKVFHDGVYPLHRRYQSKSND